MLSWLCRGFDAVAMCSLVPHVMFLTALNIIQGMGKSFEYYDACVSHAKITERGYTAQWLLLGDPKNDIQQENGSAHV